MRAVDRCIGLCSLAVLVCLSGGCGGSQYGTPEATSLAAKSALERGDYQAFCHCLTTEARDEMAAGLVMLGGFMQLGADGRGPEAEKARVRARKIRAVLERHGLNVQNTPKMSISLVAGKEEQKREMLKLVEPIKDRDALIADFIRVLIEASDKPDAKLIEPDARLVNLRTGTDTATATFAQTRQGKEKTSPIEFKKVDGEWKISELPRLMN